MVEFSLESTILQKDFLKIVQFLYTGVVKLNQNDTALGTLVQAAKTLECPHLVTVCENLIDKAEDFEILNASIGTWLNDEAAKHMKELYFNRPETADFEFLVSQSQEGEPEQVIHAHKIVLFSRCPVLAAMLTGRFTEANGGKSGKGRMVIPDTEYDTLAGFVEYLYTEHAPIEETGPHGLIEVANKYGVTRLITLCELYATREIDKAIAAGIFKADIDIVDILQHAQVPSPLFTPQLLSTFVTLAVLLHRSIRRCSWPRFVVTSLPPISSQCRRRRSSRNCPRRISSTSKTISGHPNSTWRRSRGTRPR